ncbi:MAG: hypothetical protein MZW92_08905 [Comamonadaceae bacterium]|nr:hypothetical protein [Comamonadaceae bacterium]
MLILGTGGTIAGTARAAPTTSWATPPAQLRRRAAGRGGAGAGRRGRSRPRQLARLDS